SEARAVLLQDPEGREKPTLQDQPHERRAPLPPRPPGPESLEPREDRGLAPTDARDVPALPELHAVDHEQEACDAGDEARDHRHSKAPPRDPALAEDVRGRAAPGARRDRGLRRPREKSAARARLIVPSAEDTRSAGDQKARSAGARVPGWGTSFRARR